jgi:SAM-dependent methyltransferase
MTEQHFDIELKDIVPEYHRKGRISELFTLRLIHAVNYLHQINANTVLDVGCGEGALFNYIPHSSFTKLVGVDLNKNVTRLNGVGNTTFHYADILTYTVNEPFDVVVCLDVLEHFEQLPIEKIKSLGRHLILSGPTESLVYKLGRLVTKGTWSEKIGPGAGRHYWNVKQIDKALQRNGFVKLMSNKIRCFGFSLFHVNLYKVGK